MQIVSVGIDLGKTTFHLVALGVAGKVLVRKKFTRRSGSSSEQGVHYRSTQKSGSRHSRSLGRCSCREFPDLTEKDGRKNGLLE
jgi:hypothetical protein